MSIENAQGPPGGPAGELRAALVRSRVAAIAFLADLLVLFILVVFLDGRVQLRIPVQEPSVIQTLRLALFVAAAASVLAVRLANGRMLQAARKAEGDGARLVRLGRAALISLALSMIPAAIGFVLFLIAGQTRDFHILAFASLLLMFFYFPRPAAWEAILADRMPACRL